MQIVNLEVAKRTEFGKSNTKRIKAQGFIPAVIYGEKMIPVNIIIERAKLEAIYRKTGKNTLIKLLIKEEKQTSEETVLTHITDIDPLSRKYIHIDFQKVNMKKKIHTFPSSDKTIIKLSVTFIHMNKKSNNSHWENCNT